MHVGRKFNFLWVQGIHKTFPIQLPLRMEVSREGEVVQLPWLLWQVAFIMAALETIILPGSNCDRNVHFPRNPHTRLCADSLESLHGKHKAQLIGRELCTNPAMFPLPSQACVSIFTCCFCKCLLHSPFMAGILTKKIFFNLLNWK